MAGIVTASGRSCAVEYLDAIVLARDPAGARSRTGHSRGDAGRAWPQCVKLPVFTRSTPRQSTWSTLPAIRSGESCAGAPARLHRIAAGAGASPSREPEGKQDLRRNNNALIWHPPDAIPAHVM